MSPERRQPKHEAAIELARDWLNGEHADLSLGQMLNGKSTRQINTMMRVLMRETFENYNVALFNPAQRLEEIQAISHDGCTNLSDARKEQTRILFESIFGFTSQEAASTWQGLTKYVWVKNQQ